MQSQIWINFAFLQSHEGQFIGVNPFLKIMYIQSIGTKKLMNRQEKRLRFFWQGLYIYSKTSFLIQMDRCFKKSTFFLLFLK